MPNRFPVGPVRTACTEAAWLVLRQALTESLQEPVVEELATGDYVVRVEVVPRRVQGASSAGERRQGQPDSEHLTPLDLAIVAVTTGEPQTAPRLAGLLHRDPDSYFRSRLRRLVTLGRLAHDWRGYRIGQDGTVR